MSKFELVPKKRRKLYWISIGTIIIAMVMFIVLFIVLNENEVRSPFKGVIIGILVFIILVSSFVSNNADYIRKQLVILSF